MEQEFKLKEKLSNFKRELNSIENNYNAQIEGINQLITEAGEFNIKIEMHSYLKSYPFFVKYFENIQNNTIEIPNLVIGIHFAYGWMPTIFKFKTTDENELANATIILNKAKKGESLKNEDYQSLKKLLNGSLVGTSKLLHFINPNKFAIWDSRVHKYLKMNNINSYKFDYNIGNIANYENYLRYLSDISNSDKFSQIYEKVNQQIESKFQYNISNFRAIELLMFTNGKK